MVTKTVSMKARLAMVVLGFALALAIGSSLAVDYASVQTCWRVNGYGSGFICSPN